MGKTKDIHIIDIGDTVTLNVDKENRAWGYNPGTDGSRVKIVAWSEIAYGRTCGYGKPGIYHNKCYADVQFEDGRIENIGTFHLEPLYKHHRFERFADRRNETPLRDLPETRMWEGDRVRFEAWGKVQHGYVHHIEYLSMDDKRDNGTPWPFYNVQLDSGGSTSCEDGQLTLLTRGNPWRRAHGEPMIFVSIEEEAKFYQSQGEAEEHKNPASGNYGWTIEEALAYIAEGKAHGVYNSYGGGYNITDHYGCTPVVVTFKNEDFGKRIAQATLQYAKR